MGHARHSPSRIVFDDCECGYQGFLKESEATKFRLIRQQQGEPVDQVKCPVGKCWHVFNPMIRDKANYLQMLQAGNRRPPRVRVIRNDVRAPVANDAAPSPLPATPSSSPAVPCAKIGYGTREIAEAALADLQSAGRDEKRCYECEHCRKWHLTSLAAFVDPATITQTEVLSFMQSGDQVTVQLGKWPDNTVAGVSLHWRTLYLRLSPENASALMRTLGVVLKSG